MVRGLRCRFGYLAPGLNRPDASIRDNCKGERGFDPDNIVFMLDPGPKMSDTSLTRTDAADLVA